MISPEGPNRITGSIVTYGTTLSFLPNNFPDGDGKFIVAEDGRKLHEPHAGQVGSHPRADKPPSLSNQCGRTESGVVPWTGKFEIDSAPNNRLVEENNLEGSLRDDEY